MVFRNSSFTLVCVLTLTANLTVHLPHIAEILCNRKKFSVSILNFICMVQILFEIFKLLIIKTQICSQKQRIYILKTSKNNVFLKPLDVKLFCENESQINVVKLVLILLLTTTTKKAVSVYSNYIKKKKSCRNIFRNYVTWTINIRM